MFESNEKSKLQFITVKKVILSFDVIDKINNYAMSIYLRVEQKFSIFAISLYYVTTTFNVGIWKTVLEARADRLALRTLN